MPIFAGLDTDEFPGIDAMAELRAKTNLMFTGYYLAPAPAHHNAGWMGKRAALAAQGWGFLPVYVGRQLTEALSGGGKVIDPGLPTSEGSTDGTDAARLMQAEGFPSGCYVYLDIESGPPLTAVLRQYVQGWCVAVRRAGYAPAVYCSHALADTIAAVVPGVRIWVVKVASTARHDASHYGWMFPTPDPHAGGFQFAYAWQHEQNADIVVGEVRLTVDLNVAVLRDPSR